jgi:16S rRNA (cytosine1402-N4)-methyltransferase
MRRHRPAMLREVLELLAIKTGATVVDGTIGHGGHADAMMRLAGDEGELIGFDWDEKMLRKAEDNLSQVKANKVFVNEDFRAIPDWMDAERPGGADAILLDFGVNLEHFEDTSRGFSFSADAPLDMRMNRASKETAAAWLNRASEGEIARVLREYGGELWAGPIAKQIVKIRKESRLKTTSDLVTAVLKAIPASKRDKRIHPATRTFQAVRIRVNEELVGLQEAIRDIAHRLKPSGRLVTLSYHSGEDAAAKSAFRGLARAGEFTILTKKPLRPSQEEIQDNPNARSAKLRAIERKETV